MKERHRHSWKEMYTKTQNANTKRHTHTDTEVHTLIHRVTRKRCSE